MRKYIPIVLVVFLFGCAGFTAPTTPAASLALAEITMEKVVDELVFYRDNGWIEDETWLDIKATVEWTSTVLNSVHAALNAKDEELALILLTSVNEGLRDLQVHIRGNR